ncbi:hypothetical protein RJT34_29631 [Clitoria ternatea]|uniref:Acyl carrier protein n=1 Tax=Clitoria ternatea TaxID=43366 RepID=A0AAN9ERL5_CLITE
MEQGINRTWKEESIGDSVRQNIEHVADQSHLSAYLLNESQIFKAREFSNMQSIKKSILSRVNLRRSTKRWFFAGHENTPVHLRCWCSSTGASSDVILDRVVRLVKKYDKIDAAKVTETADFQKDLSLDSLDRVELIMALEEEFSIEIPDEKANKLTCCADVAKYIDSGTDEKIMSNP